MVVKADGTTEAFDEHTIRQSLRRAHIPLEFHNDVLREIQNGLYQNIPTREIYRYIRNYFSARYPKGSSSYNLKQAIMELGPSGYPFERYVGAMRRKKGYQVQIGQIMRGKCVSHEVDVLAVKGDEHFMVECKFHNQPGLRSDIKVALYTKARFDDLLNYWLMQEAKTGLHAKHHGWLITNTKCTIDAIQYAQCAGIKVMGWNYPEEHSLQAWIDETRMYPVTILTSLTKTEQHFLLEKDIVSAAEIFEYDGLVEQLRLEPQQLQQLREEVQMLNEGASVAKD